MAERAHPDDPGFRNHWRFRLRRGLIPWLSHERNIYRREFFWRYRWAGGYVRDRDVLEAPCGMGWGTSLLQGARSLLGMDCSAEAVEEAVRRYSSHARFLRADLGKLPFISAAFDLVICMEGIEHVGPEVGQAFIFEAARVLRPGGMLLLSSPHCRTGGHSGNPCHIYEYQPSQIIALVEQRFTVESLVSRDVDKLTVSYLRALRRS